MYEIEVERGDVLTIRLNHRLNERQGGAGRSFEHSAKGARMSGEGRSFVGVNASEKFLLHSPSLLESQRFMLYSNRFINTQNKRFRKTVQVYI
jgi:hypothetical protein